MKKGNLIDNELFTDYKAAAKAADLIERGIIDAENIEILPLGADKRAYAKEIEQTSTYFSEQRRTERIRIEVNREGLYDMLPEGLFHRPPSGSSSLDEEGMIQDVRTRREEEKTARKFFSPFDAELNHMRMMIELYENRLDKKTAYTDLNRLFEFGWDEFRLLNREQSIIWMHLLPEIHQKRNDIDFIGQLLTALFNIPFNLINSSHQVKPVAIQKDLQMELGKSDLGINTIIGPDFMPDHDQLSLDIGPASAEDLLQFMPGSTQREILDMVLNYLVPVETEVVIDLRISEDQKIGTLDAESPNVFLGYTVYL